MGRGWILRRRRQTHKHLSTAAPKPLAPAPGLECLPACQGLGKHKYNTTNTKQMPINYLDSPLMIRSDSLDISSPIPKRLGKIPEAVLHNKNRESNQGSAFSVIEDDLTENGLSPKYSLTETTSSPLNNNTI